MRTSDTPIFSVPRRRFLRSGAVSAVCLANPWVVAAPAAEGEARTEPNETIWELSLKNSHATNCSLSFACVVPNGPGKFSVEADSRQDKTTWHSCIFVPAGLLKSGLDYVITVNYEIVDRLTEDAYFYVFARSNRLG